ncbi:FAD-binding oxidoreductase (plasmid) [Streptomyces sp. AHU1]|uniref:FAD-binding oxidoreductase n=1 Tax=Streptomyces sp. AHU1 TaxID=3377215 RepID=UPI00387835B3
MALALDDFRRRGLRVMDARALRESFEMACRSGDEVPQYFYAQLFLRAPEVRSMFPVSMGAQRDRLLTALGHITSQADQLDRLTPYLQQLGRDHRKFDVVIRHYEVVGECLLATLAYFLGEAWTPELEMQWISAYELVAQTMAQAAVDDERVNPAWWQAEVVRHERRSVDLAVVTLLLNQPMRYTAGQSVMLELPLMPSTWRAFTPANVARTDGTVELHVRAVDGGLVSPAIVYGLNEGDVVRLGAPIGSVLTLASSRGRDLVMVAGGTGLAPMRAMIEELAVTGAQRQVDLFVAAREESGFYDLPMLRHMEHSYPWLRVWPLSGSDAGTLEDRSLAKPVLRGGRWDERAFYVCGSPRMVSATVKDLTESGIRGDLLFFEEDR